MLSSIPPWAFCEGWAGCVAAPAEGLPDAAVALDDAVLVVPCGLCFACPRDSSAVFTLLSSSQPSPAAASPLSTAAMALPTCPAAAHAPARHACPPPHPGLISMHLTASLRACSSSSRSSSRHRTWVDNVSLQPSNLAVSGHMLPFWQVPRRGVAWVYLRDSTSRGCCAAAARKSQGCY